MVNIKVKRDFNLNNIKLDFSKQLNKGLDVIALDIQKGIEKGSQFGKPFKRNAESTIKKKGFDHPLKENGLMMDSGKMVKTKATHEHQVAVLAPNESRTDIGFWNDRGTSTIPARQFWGISEKANRHIMKSIEYEIIKELKRA